MEIILLERIEKLGQMGDVVRVKDGFARNYLLPQMKALRATQANMERFEQERATLEKRNAELKAGAEQSAQGIDGRSFVVIRQAGENGQLYGSVSTRDIATAASEAGTEVKRGQVILDKAIKQLGVHEVRIALHPEVMVSVSVNVARTPEEAERQARGEDVTAEPEAGEEAAIAPEEVFESEEQAREASEELAEAEEEAAAGEEAAPEETGDGETQTAGTDGAGDDGESKS